MPRAKTWQGGVQGPDAERSLGRLQVFQLGKAGAFRLVHEVDPIVSSRAHRVKRAGDAVGYWRSQVGNDALLFCRDPGVLAAFKAWRAGL